MATRAAKTIIRRVFDGSLSISEMDRERRPYHKNCRCALHKRKDAPPSACSQHRRISYANKQSWNEHSLSITAFSRCSEFLYEVSDLLGKKTMEDLQGFSKR